MKLFVAATLTGTLVLGEMPLLKRQPAMSDIRWTFDFPGVPNDPTVNIDSQTEQRLGTTFDFTNPNSPNIGGITTDSNDFLADEQDALAELLLANLQGTQVMSMPTTAPVFSAPTVPTVPFMPTTPAPFPAPTFPTISTLAPNLVPFISPIVPTLSSVSPVSPGTTQPIQSIAPVVNPSHAPTTGPPTGSTLTLMPVEPSPSPTLSPILPPTNQPTKSPTDPVATPLPTQATTAFPTPGPTVFPTAFPTPFPTPNPTPDPVVLQPAPSTSPSASPFSTPSASPSMSPSSSPTMAKCGLTPEQRAGQIFAQLDVVTNSQVLREPTSAQSLAAQWLIGEDQKFLCPEDPFIVQRWTLATIYFSTSGESWLQCGRVSSDDCGQEAPFLGDQRFLSEFCECEWAGIVCSPDMIVTEIEFEENGLVGTIPTEIGLLPHLEVWGMERGELTGTIPTEIGLLTNLRFLDLDFNQLTGTLTSELLSLSKLDQLDLNDNQLSGSIEGIGVFPSMEFLQLHSNNFNGTIPASVGSFSNLSVFTVHETMVTGAMPDSVCDLVTAGSVNSLIADCDTEIVCDCCTDCRSN